MFVLVRSDILNKYIFTNLSGILLKRGGLDDCYSNGNSSHRSRLALRDLTSESGKKNNSIHFSLLIVLKCNSGRNDGIELNFNHDLD